MQKSNENFLHENFAKDLNTLIGQSVCKSRENISTLKLKYFE